MKDFCLDHTLSSPHLFLWNLEVLFLKFPFFSQMQSSPLMGPKFQGRSSSTEAHTHRPNAQVNLISIGNQTKMCFQYRAFPLPREPLQVTIKCHSERQWPEDTEMPDIPPGLFVASLFWLLWDEMVVTQCSCTCAHTRQSLKGDGFLREQSKVWGMWFFQDRQLASSSGT